MKQNDTAHCNIFSVLYEHVKLYFIYGILPAKKVINGLF